MGVISKLAVIQTNRKMREEPISIKNKHRFTSYIGLNQSWWDYYTQYKITVDKIVSLIESGTPVDTVSLPLLFLTRHSIELGLKANIFVFQKINSIIPKIKLNGAKSHSIEFLHSKFEEHINAILKEKKVTQKTRDEILSYLEKVEQLKDVIHRLDEVSFNFRYPVDTKEVPNFERKEVVQIDEIIEVYYKIHSFILFTENVLTVEGVFIPEL